MPCRPRKAPPMITMPTNIGGRGPNFAVSMPPSGRADDEHPGERQQPDAACTGE